MRKRGQCLWRVFLVLTLFLGSALSAVAITEEDPPLPPRPDAVVWDYYGPGEVADDVGVTITRDYFSLLGEKLDAPSLTLDASSITVSFVDDGPFNLAAGVLFETLGAEELPDATVTLINDSHIRLMADTTSEEGDAPLDMTGVLMWNFDESHVSLSGGSTIEVEAISSAEANAYGVALEYISGETTASVTLDGGLLGGSSIDVYAESKNGYSAEAGGVYLADDAHGVVSLDQTSSIQVEANAYGDEGDTPDAEAIAVDTSNVDVVGVTLEGGSTITAESNSSYRANSEAVYIDDANESTITLAGGSTLNAIASAVVGGVPTGDAYSRGLYVEDVQSSEEGDGTVDISLTGLSAIGVDATGGYAEAMAIEIDDEALVSLDLTDSALRASATASEDTAQAMGAKFYGHSDVTATLISSAITAEAFSSDDQADARAFQSGGYSTLGLSLDASSISATAEGSTAYDLSERDDAIYSVAIRILPNNVSTVDLLNGSSVISEAINNMADEGGAMSRGIDVGQDEDDNSSFSLTMDDASTIESNATANGEVLSQAIYVGGYMVVDIALDGASELHASAMSGNDALGSDADAYGIYASGNSTIDIDLGGESAINVSALSNADEATATGISVRGYTTVNSLSVGGASTINVAAVNNGTEESSVATAYGISVQGVDTSVENITLSGGSGIVAIATSEYGDAVSYGLFVDGDELELVDDTPDAPSVIPMGVETPEYLNVTLNVDATSSIFADWAVYNYRGTVIVNNSGLLAGRLDVTTLNNAASGILQATLSGDSEFQYFSGEKCEYYFRAGTATLADGSTFRINPIENLGFLQEGDSASYALLEASEEGGDWSQNQLRLTSTSPLLGLSWHEDSDADHLIVTATLLSVVQAGLSANATRAYSAALADGLVNYDSSPEKWVPNVSDAFITGMRHALGSSYFSIGNRLGALMGLNSGDEIATSNGLWFSGRYTEADQSRRDGVVGFDADTSSISIGFDHEFGDTIAGFAFTHGSTDAKAHDKSAVFDMDDDLFSLYGGYDAGLWYVEGIVSAGFGNVNSTRYAGVQAYEGDYDSTSYNAKMEGGLKYNLQGWQFNPVFASEYSRKEYDSYTEDGDALALYVHSQDYEVFTVGAGARVQKEIQTNWGSVTPEASGLLSYDLSNDRIVTTANFVGGNTAFVAIGSEPSELSWQLGAAVTLAIPEQESLSLRLGYDYSGRADFDAHSVTGKLRFEF